MSLKTTEEIKHIREAGQKMGQILDELVRMVKPGVTAWDIDQEAERRIREVGGIPAFKGYQPHKSDPPFPSTICASLNEEVVHGIATKEKVLKEGDIFSIDIGMQYPANSGLGKNGNGFFVDTAVTVPVGEVAEPTKQLLAITKKTLEIGINAAQKNNTIADIGRAVQGWVEPQGYGIVRDLVGHGVGHEIHEEPRVPNYYDSSLENWKVQPGMVIAIEPMITVGDHHVEVAEDGWSISTKDKKLSAHFEHTIVITEDGPEVVTRRPSEK